MNIGKLILHKLISDHSRSSAYHLALLSAMANKILERRFGYRHAEEIMKEIVKEFASVRGKEIRKRVLAAGKPLTVENLLVYYDLAVVGKKPRAKNVDGWFVLEIDHPCPFRAAAIGCGCEMHAMNYCKYFDSALVHAYNDEIEFEHSYPEIDGDKCVLKYRERVSNRFIKKTIYSSCNGRFLAVQFGMPAASAKVVEFYRIAGTVQFNLRFCGAYLHVDWILRPMYETPDYEEPRWKRALFVALSRRARLHGH